MRLTVLNLTDDSVVFSYGDGRELLALSSRPTTINTPKRCSAAIYLGREKHIDWATVNFQVSNTNGSWKMLSTPEDSLWRLYLCKVAPQHRKLVIIPRRSLPSFLSPIPDSVPISRLLLPGTHDTMAFYGWPFSQCQSISTPLDVQFRSGIRVLDIRLTDVNGRLIAYHGAYPQKTPFQDILISVHNFLTSPEGSRETIVMSIKQEAPSVVFSQLVHDEIYAGAGGRDMWFFESRIPTLGEVRGKVVLFSRFGNGDGWENGLNGMGIHPTRWPDSEKRGFKWMCNDTVVRTNDWYHIPSFLSIPEKVALATGVLEPRPSDKEIPALPITYFSASSFPLAAPQTISQGFGWPRWGLGVEGVNNRTGKWALDRLSNNEESLRIRGWTFLDYYEEPKNSLVPLLVEFNFRGRTEGEEGWQA
ncbi:PLCXc domain-containing protein [Mycena indigotica]|uniref:PLCXc domain-containing protein n=1 Tax=Mycena indigotica TaxID=2126181 RepID=A0A8H6VUS9_9AGAR|nr:PLCXc domain-containing protein [Mycena indigotica]KAF7294707.1 PLCXc domain-containing protein [Mycena indigotica]